MPMQSSSQENLWDAKEQSSSEHKQNQEVIEEMLWDDQTSSDDNKITENTSVTSGIKDLKQNINKKVEVEEVVCELLLDEESGEDMFGKVKKMDIVSKSEIVDVKPKLIGLIEENIKNDNNEAEKSDNKLENIYLPNEVKTNENFIQKNENVDNNEDFCQGEEKIENDDIINSSTNPCFEEILHTEAKDEDVINENKKKAETNDNEQIFEDKTCVDEVNIKKKDELLSKVENNIYENEFVIKNNDSSNMCIEKEQDKDLENKEKENDELKELFDNLNDEDNNINFLGAENNKDEDIDNEFNIEKKNKILIEKNNNEIDINDGVTNEVEQEKEVNGIMELQNDGLAYSNENVEADNELISENKDNEQQDDIIHENEESEINKDMNNRNFVHYNENNMNMDINQCYEILDEEKESTLAATFEDDDSCDFLQANVKESKNIEIE